jgi:hypothetical protein
MICPFCSIAYSDTIIEEFRVSREDALGAWIIHVRKCPECNRMNLSLTRFVQIQDGGSRPLWQPSAPILIYPRVSSRPPCSIEVPKDFAEDYNESALILNDSPKASAALSRRCLQHILREMANVKKNDLSKEIDEILARKTLPSHLAESIDAIRVVGNFAAHPTKSTTTGEIISVEPGEADLLLDVIEGLFDYYFVSPAKMAQKKAAINKRLADAGKPPMK